MKLRSIILLLVVAFVHVLQSCASTRDQLEPFFGAPKFGEISLSPDGSLIAFVLKRALSTSPGFHNDILDGNDRSDVWVTSARNGVARNITHGAQDASGFWAPTWSPDGMYVAILSTREQPASLWLWSRKSGSLQKISCPSVDETRGRPIWLSNRYLLVQTVAEGELPMQFNLLPRTFTAQIANAWSSAQAGNKPIDSVVTPGIDDATGAIQKGHLILVDITSYQTKDLLDHSVVLPYPKPTLNGFVLLQKHDYYPFNRTKRLSHAQGARVTYSIGFVSENGVRAIAGPNNITTLGSVDVLKLSPVGNEVVFMGPVDGTEWALRRLRLVRNRWNEVDVHGIKPTIETRAFEPFGHYCWSANGIFAVLGTGQRETSTRWWVEQSDHRFVPLTGDRGPNPAELIPGSTSSSFIGVADGALWSFDLLNRPPRDLTPSLPHTISSILHTDTAADGTTAGVLLSTELVGESILYYLNLRSGQLREIGQLNRESEFLGFSSASSLLVTFTRSQGQLELRLTHFDTNISQSVIEVPALSIKFGRVRHFQYQSRDGQHLHGWLYLPVDYEPGKRYPEIVVAYPGLMFGNEEPDNPDSPWPNWLLLCSHGYLVLMPSMPSTAAVDKKKPHSGLSVRAGDPLFELPNGVEPAVAKTIEMGIADENRIGLIGHSMGGFAVYGLITLTTRFKAAVAISGISDFFSLYGTFDARYRYQSHQSIFAMTFLEGGPGRMLNPPWLDPLRYIRNSPVSRANKVQTPLMIIHSDLDYLPVQQAEEMFSALERQNKTVVFIRYWGEDHILSNPENIIDAWDRIFAWFDKYLAQPSYSQNSPN